MKTTYVMVAALLSLPAAAVAQEDGIRGQWSLSVTGGASLPGPSRASAGFHRA